MQRCLFLTLLLNAPAAGLVIPTKSSSSSKSPSATASSSASAHETISMSNQPSDSSRYTRVPTPSGATKTPLNSLSVRITRHATMTQAASIATWTPSNSAVLSDSSVRTASGTPSNSRTPSHSPTTSSTLSFSPTASNSQTPSMTSTMTRTPSSSQTLYGVTPATFAFGILIGQFDNATGAYSLMSKTSSTANSLAYALAKGLGLDGTATVELISLVQTTYNIRSLSSSNNKDEVGGGKEDDKSSLSLGKDQVAGMDDRSLALFVVTSTYVVVAVNAAAVTAQGLLGTTPPSLTTPTGVVDALTLFNLRVTASTGAMLTAIAADTSLLAMLGADSPSQVYVSPIGKATFTLAASQSATPSPAAFSSSSLDAGTAPDYVWGLVVAVGLIFLLSLGWYSYLAYFQHYCERASAEHTKQSLSPLSQRPPSRILRYICTTTHTVLAFIRNGGHVNKLPPDSRSQDGTGADEIEVTIDVDDIPSDARAISSSSAGGGGGGGTRVGKVIKLGDAGAGVGYLAPQNRGTRSATARALRTSRAIRGGGGGASPVKLSREALIALAGAPKNPQGVKMVSSPRVTFDDVSSVGIAPHPSSPVKRPMLGLEALRVGRPQGQDGGPASPF
jgi:hypothetical protein